MRQYVPNDISIFKGIPNIFAAGIKYIILKISLNQAVLMCLSNYITLPLIAVECNLLDWPIRLSP